MLGSAPWGNESKIANYTQHQKQERLLLISRWSGCKFCQGLGPLCMNYKEENKKWNLLILRAPSSQKTEEIWLENCTKNVNMLQICMFAQMKIVEVEFINIWRLNILWWPEMEDSLSSGEVPAAAKAIPPPIEWPICWIFFIIIILVLWLIWYNEITKMHLLMILMGTMIMAAVLVIWGSLNGLLQWLFWLQFWHRFLQYYSKETQTHCSCSFHSILTKWVGVGAFADVNSATKSREKKELICRYI